MKSRIYNFIYELYLCHDNSLDIWNMFTTVSTVNIFFFSLVFNVRQQCVFLSFRIWFFPSFLFFPLFCFYSFYGYCDVTTFPFPSFGSLFVFKSGKVLYLVTLNQSRFNPVRNEDKTSPFFFFFVKWVWIWTKGSMFKPDERNYVSKRLRMEMQVGYFYRIG